MQDRDALGLFGFRFRPRAAGDASVSESCGGVDDSPFASDDVEPWLGGGDGTCLAASVPSSCLRAVPGLGHRMDGR